MAIFQRVFEHFSKRADIKINGNRPQDITVHNEQFYRRVVLHGSVGLGDSYMEGWWDSDKVDEFASHLLDAHLDHGILNILNIIFLHLSQKVFNFQSIRRAFIVGEQHYDIGNDLYTKMLDSRLTYTCGYWKDAKTLEEAQENKLRLTCEKLGLKPGMRVLDIGCGWGSFAIFAAKEYGVSVVGVTISKEQVALAQKRAGDLPVEFRLIDYRNMPKEYDNHFDRVVSLGMFEHVGRKNYPQFFSIVDSVLTDDGLFLLHTIGTESTYNAVDPWINKHIFPNGILPTLHQVEAAAQKDFVMEDWHNFGMDYSKTLMAWYHNVEKSWDTLPSYDERFKRMWRYYLLMSAGAFRVRQIQLWQVVFSRGNKSGYKSVR